MTILAALTAHYERLASEGATPLYGYSNEGISFVIELRPDGRVVDVADVRQLPDDGSSKFSKPKPKRMDVPYVDRTSNIVPQFLWDNAKYALGVTLDEGVVAKGKAEKAHEAFCTMHRTLLGDTTEPGLLALLRFLDEWQADDFSALRYADEILGQKCNVVFRLDGERPLLHELPESRERWVGHVEESANDASRQQGQCLVTGDWGSLAKTHHRVKGVRGPGAQSSGASLVSFNFPATKSYGKSQSYNAPVSNRSAFAYSTALNALLRTDRKVNVGGTTTVFWACAGGDGDAQGAEDAIRNLVRPADDRENAKLTDLFAKMTSGAPFSWSDLTPLDIDERTRFYVLGISPNAARLAVRFWWEGEVGELARRIVEHWLDLHLIPLPSGWPPTPFRLLCETAVQRRGENIPPTLEGGLMRAIFKGERYPAVLLSAVLGRIRTGGEHGRVNGLRAAICRACIARDHRLGFEKENVPVSLNRDEPNVAYQMGRLFAVLEKAQADALPNLNVTIKDRFFGSASSTPAVVLPTLIGTCMKAHIPALRKERAGAAIRHENEIAAIMDQIDSSGFPATLGLRDQGRFTIGYYHERQGFLYAKRKDDAPIQTHDDEEE